MKKKQKSIVGILLGKARTPAQAKSIAKWFSWCIYCNSCTNEGCLVIAVVAIPQHHRWWFESIAEHPKETVGLKQAEVFFTQHIKAASQWSSGSVKPILKRAPCGADCHWCPEYHKKCSGCLATQYYLQ